MVDNSPMIGPWPNEQCVSFINPCETSRKVFIWSCGTHSLKAMRNNLYRSQPNMARNLRKSDVYFGWKDMETILLRDEARTTNKQKVRTDLNTNNVNLDQYTLMNATYAKAHFTENNNM